MKKMKNYQDFINEEINLKKALVGGAIAASTLTKMRHLKLFENFNSITETEIENYLKEQFTSDWFDSELMERCHDYIGPDEAADFDDDYEEAYKSLCTGGAIEYDLLKDMAEDVCQHFNISDAGSEIDKRDVRDICKDHLIDTCEWYDKSVFTKSSDPPNSFFGKSYLDLTKNWDNAEKDLGLKL